MIFIVWWCKLVVTSGMGIESVRRFLYFGITSTTHCIIVSDQIPLVPCFIWFDGLRDRDITAVIVLCRYLAAATAHDLFI